MDFGVGAQLRCSTWLGRQDLVLLHRAQLAKDIFVFPNSRANIKISGLRPEISKIRRGR